MNILKKKTAVCIVLLLALLLTCPAAVFSVSAQSGNRKFSLNKKKIVLYTGLKKYRSETLLASLPEGQTGKIRFKSTNPSAAKVSRKGKVTAVSVGTAWINAVWNGHKASCAVKVKKPVFTLRSSSHLTLKQGEKSRLRFRIIPKDCPVSYRSSDPSTVSVDKSGNVQGLKQGKARIKVSCQKKTIAVSVTVTGEMAVPSSEILYWNSSWPYAANSRIHQSSVTLYHAFNPKQKVVAVNAGHGTAGGSSVYTLCHPNGTPKVTGGSTGAGSIRAVSVSSGTVLLDGTPEASATLSLARILKNKLLLAGYDVLMIREGADVQLDNIARAVFANQYADCHISLHNDSSAGDKGAYANVVPQISSYLGMEPVASHWQQHNRLGTSLIRGMQSRGVRIYGNGTMGVDLTQTSYSTVPSICMEVGDRASDHGSVTQGRIADGIVDGVGLFFAGQ